jgi:hypothetical protein
MEKVCVKTKRVVVAEPDTLWHTFLTIPRSSDHRRGAHAPRSPSHITSRSPV